MRTNLVQKDQHIILAAILGKNCKYYSFVLKVMCKNLVQKDQHLFFHRVGLWKWQPFWGKS